MGANFTTFSGTTRATRALPGRDDDDLPSLKHSLHTKLLLSPWQASKPQLLLLQYPSNSTKSLSHPYQLLSPKATSNSLPPWRPKSCASRTLILRAIRRQMTKNKIRPWKTCSRIAQWKKTLKILQQRRIHQNLCHQKRKSNSPSECLKVPRR